MTTAPDQVLAGGRYRLLERLAVGGMGEVWRSRDESLGRKVAIKVLKDEYAADETFLTRFRAEARNTAGLSHPGIAAVYDYGEEAGLAYLVMELVPGRPLSAFLARGGRLSADVTLDVVAQASRALQAAHGAGLIHRDIKPGNLIITPDGVVKITDFGIARGVHAATLTQTGQVLGTAQYVSPEQAQGRQLTAATDIYSLGVVAYQCLAGRLPFEGESAVAVALAQVRDQPPSLPGDVPAAARELVERCLDKDPQMRPASAGELADLARRARQQSGGGAEAGSGALAPTVPDGGYPATGGTLGWDGARTSRLEGAATPGGATRVEGATRGAAAVWEDHPDHAGMGGARSPRRRRVLLTAGLASIGVVFAVLLALGLSWGVFSAGDGTEGTRPGDVGRQAPPAQSPDSGGGDAEPADGDESGGRRPSPDGQTQEQQGQQGQQGGEANRSGDPDGGGQDTPSPDGTGPSPTPSGTSGDGQSGGGDGGSGDGQDGTARGQSHGDDAAGGGQGGGQGGGRGGGRGGEASRAQDGGERGGDRDPSEGEGVRTVGTRHAGHVRR